MKHLLYIGLLLGAFGCKSTKDSSVTSTKTAATVESPAFQTAFFDGQAAKTIEDYDRAYQAFERSVSISPNNSAPYYEMSRIDFMYDRTFQGLTNIRKALEISPDNYWYRKTYAGYLMELEKLEDAAFQWQKLIKADPEDIMSYHNLAMCYLFLDEEKSAIEVYNQLEKRMGLMPEISYQKQRLYLLSGDFEGALREVDKLIEAYPGEVEFIAQKAELLVELNRAQEAQALLESVVKEQPENGYAQLELSRIYAAQGKDSESFEALVKAFGAVEVDIDEKIGILLRYFEVSRFDDQAAKNANQLLEVLDKVHPNDPKTHSIYGDFLYRDQRLEEAEMRFQKALELDPARPVLWNQLLSIELELRKWEAAAEHAGQAKDLYPTQPEFYIMEAHSFLQLKKYKDAIATLSIGKNFVVDNPSMLSQMHAMLGEAYNETKEFEKSDENFEKAIKQDSPDPYVLNNYAYYLALRGDKLNRAEELSKKSLEMKPESASFQDTYGWILFRLGRYDEARQFIERAISTGGSDAVVLEHLGDVYFHLGDIDNALRLWNDALKSGSNERLSRKIADRKYYEE